MDNLNTHTAAALYETFPSSQAKDDETYQPVDRFINGNYPAVQASIQPNLPRSPPVHSMFALFPVEAGRYDPHA
ncbi:hypothetical protein BSU04_27445 [Caballeronia sordidicola]|uniref:Uncharacterized protein n=1 Tax=Caballeronia sordidicola TaxID=196367 RepID=A0A226WW18_CABSO|nr:hypothetical protein BSU04_27445 [Caballeronia sordidicola]